MYYQAISDYNIDLGYSFAIGDKIRDCVIAELTDCKGILIGTNENQDIINEVKAGKHSNVEYAKDLLEASKIIVEST
jgi:histidinol phosphatase-like enzyme